MKRLSLPDRTVDLAARLVQGPSGDAVLTDPEARLLTLLVQAAGEPVSRSRLLTEALGFAPGVDSRAADHAITRLRRKLERDPADPQHLLSVYGVGYRLALPSGDSDLVGRHLELELLSAEWGRVVILHGPAGVGKTRLAHAHLHHRPHTWVGLQDSVDLAEAFADLRRCLGLDTGAELPPALADRGPTLLVLDGIEHLPALDEVIRRWLDAAPHLRLLLTSQRRLQLTATLLPVPPLSQPELAALFRHHCREAPPPSLLPILHELTGGLPLAAEFVVARRRLLSWEQLGERANSLSVLGDGRRSMATSLDGTWHHLEPSIRSAWRVLGLFRGGFTLEAWEGICDLAHLEGIALEGLQALLDWGLVRPLADTARLEVPGPVRLYALGRLDEDPAAATLGQSHGRWYGERGAALEEAARLRGETTWLRLERANLRAAFDRGHGGQAVTRALDTLLKLAGPPEARVSILAAALERCTTSEEQADIHWRLADALLATGRAPEGLALLSEPDQPPRGLLLRGSLHLALGQLEQADAELNRAIAQVDPALAAVARFNLSHVRALQGDLDGARGLASQALVDLDRLGATALRAGVLSGLAAYALEAGEVDEARLYLKRARAAGAGVHPHHALRLEYAVAHVLLAEGRLREALEAFEATGAAAEEAGLPGVAEDCLEGAAAVHCERGQLETALRKLEEAQAAHRLRGRRLREAGLAGRAALVEALMGGDGRPRLVEVTGDLPDEIELRGVLAALHQRAGQPELIPPLGPLPTEWSRLLSADDGGSGPRAPAGSLLRLARRLNRPKQA